MRRIALLSTLAGCAIAIPAAQGATAASAPRFCGHIDHEVRHIQATDTGCRNARRLIQSDIQGGKYRHWHCSGKPAGRRDTDVTCKHRHGGLVTFTVVP